MFTLEKPKEKSSVQKKEPTSMSQNRTGIPNGTKTRFENLSGFSFNDVRVHYNSSKPAHLQALAYTQGNDVHIAPGQERHLNHELGHVVQQKQGIVKPNASIGGQPVNTSRALERAADSIGGMTAQRMEREQAQGVGVIQMERGNHFYNDFFDMYISNIKPRLTNIVNNLDQYSHDDYEYKSGKVMLDKINELLNNAGDDLKIMREYDKYGNELFDGVPVDKTPDDNSQLSGMIANDISKLLSKMANFADISYNDYNTLIKLLMDLSSKMKFYMSDKDFKEFYEDNLDTQILDIFSTITMCVVALLEGYRDIVRKVDSTFKRHSEAETIRKDFMKEKKIEKSMEDLLTPKTKATAGKEISNFISIKDPETAKLSNKHEGLISKRNELYKGLSKLLHDQTYKEVTIDGVKYSIDLNETAGDGNDSFLTSLINMGVAGKYTVTDLRNIMKTSKEKSTAGALEVLKDTLNINIIVAHISFKIIEDEDNMDVEKTIINKLATIGKKAPRKSVYIAFVFGSLYVPLRKYVPEPIEEFKMPKKGKKDKKQ